MMVWEKNRYTSQQNRIESTETNLHKQNQLISDKTDKETNGEK